MDTKLFDLIKELDNEYSELRDRLCIKKADEDLARLTNLREEFDDFYKNYPTEIKAELADRPQVFFDTYINLINEADNTVELDGIVKRAASTLSESSRIFMTVSAPFSLTCMA